MSESMKTDLKDSRVPNCIYWTVEDVTKWIEELGYPDYKVKLGHFIIAHTKIGSKSK